MELFGLSLTAASGIAPASAGRSTGDAVFTIDGILPNPVYQGGPANSDPVTGPVAGPESGLQDDSTAEPKAEEMLGFLPFAASAAPPAARPLPLALNRLGIAENTSLPASVDLMSVMTQRMETTSQPLSETTGASVNITDDAVNNLTDSSVESTALTPGAQQAKLPANILNDAGLFDMQSTALPITANADGLSSKPVSTAGLVEAGRISEAASAADSFQPGADQNDQERSAKSPVDVSALIRRETAAKAQDDVFTAEISNAVDVSASNDSTLPSQINTAFAAPQLAAQPASATAANSMPFTQSATPVTLDQNFAERIGQEIAMMTKTDRGISLQVAPANLGIINIEIMADPAGDTVRLTSENAEVRQMILQTQARIEQDMRAAGQKLAGFEVAGSGVSSGGSDSSASGNAAQQNMADTNRERAAEQTQAREFYGSARIGNQPDDPSVGAATNDQVRYA